MLWTELSVDGKAAEKVRIVPGAWRERDIIVGDHVAVSPGAVPRFLARFEEAYRPDRLSRLRRIIAIPASHHRLLWIHPFTDGNSRVARLLTHVQLRDTGIGTSLWSVARGLARCVGDYKAFLIAADQPRRGDLDGRGSRTLAGLIEFCYFSLASCIDQIDFMGNSSSRRASSTGSRSASAKRFEPGGSGLLHLLCCVTP
jgi:Fic family protein